MAALDTKRWSECWGLLFLLSNMIALGCTLRDKHSGFIMQERPDKCIVNSDIFNNELDSVSLLQVRPTLSHTTNGVRPEGNLNASFPADATLEAPVNFTSKYKPMQHKAKALLGVSGILIFFICMVAHEPDELKLLSSQKARRLLQAVDRSEMNLLQEFPPDGEVLQHVAFPSVCTKLGGGMQLSMPVEPMLTNSWSVAVSCQVLDVHLSAAARPADGGGYLLEVSSEQEPLVTVGPDMHLQCAKDGTRIGSLEVPAGSSHIVLKLGSSKSIASFGSDDGGDRMEVRSTFDDHLLAHAQRCTVSDTENLQASSSLSMCFPLERM